MEREASFQYTRSGVAVFLRRLFTILSIAAVVAVAVVATCAVMASRVTINVTPSLPRGLYWLRPALPPIRGSVVALAVPPGVRELMSSRRYLPPSFQLLKRVVAIEGDRVCIAEHRYVINGMLLSAIATHDQAGRPLPDPYPYCGLVAPGTAFVAGDGPSSLDSRYFGPVTLQTLTTALPLWTSS